MVGTGLKAVGQVTQEAVSHVRRAEKLFYLVADRVTEQWVQDLNPSAESLQSSYAVSKPRRQTYEEMVERILAPVRAGRRVCAAFYGHPGVCAYPGHEAVRRARAEGGRAVMLAAVSCEDCLFADLGVDPARDGCQSYEASNFLLRRRLFDPRAALVLWQIGMLGQTDYQEPFSTAGLPLLVEVLAAAYGPAHPVTLYEAAVYPICDPFIRHVELARVPEARISLSTTLYVPPLGRAEQDPELVARLADLLRS